MAFYPGSLITTHQADSEEGILMTGGHMLDQECQDNFFGGGNMLDQCQDNFFGGGNMLDQECQDNFFGGFVGADLPREDLLGGVHEAAPGLDVSRGGGCSSFFRGVPHMPSHWETPPSSNSKCHGLEAWQLCQSIGMETAWVPRWILEPVSQIVELEAESIKILVEAQQMVHATDLRLEDKKKMAKQVRDFLIPATWASWNSQVEERLRLGSNSKKLSNLLRTILFGSEGWGSNSTCQVSKLLGGLRKALQKRYVFGQEPAVHPLVEEAINRFLSVQEEAQERKAWTIHQVASWNAYGRQDVMETKRKTLHALCDWAARSLLYLKPAPIPSNQYDWLKEFCRNFMSQADSWPSTPDEADQLPALDVFPDFDMERVRAAVTSFARAEEEAQKAEEIQREEDEAEAEARAAQIRRSQKECDDTEHARCEAVLSQIRWRVEARRLQLEIELFSQAHPREAVRFYQPRVERKVPLDVDRASDHIDLAPLSATGCSQPLHASALNKVVDGELPDVSPRLEASQLPAKEAKEARLIWKPKAQVPQPPAQGAKEAAHSTWVANTEDCEDWMSFKMPPAGAEFAAPTWSRPCKEDIDRPPPTKALREQESFEPAAMPVVGRVKSEKDFMTIPTGTILQSPQEARCRRTVTKQHGQIHVDWLNKQFKVMNWNVLADLYANETAYPYCEKWALSWDWRKHLIMKELKSMAVDIITLQEVQKDAYDDWFRPQLLEAGYEGVFQQKKRDPIFHHGKYIAEGCATFYKTSRFRRFDKQVIDYDRETSCEIPNTGDDQRCLQRLSKGNIALAVMLEDQQIKATNSCQAGPTGGHCLVVVNTHILCDPSSSDVKLWQSFLLINSLEQLGWNHWPLLLAGDFNSTPDSAVYEYLKQGTINGAHEDLRYDPSGLLSRFRMNMHHNLELSTAYAACTGHEAEFTNYTEDFKGTLDYIWFSPQVLEVVAITQVDEECELRKEQALPSSTCPSDHVSLVASFTFKEEPEQKAGRFWQPDYGRCPEPWEYGMC
ncbi:Carbon catabolite repressor protein 4 homolog 1 (CCR4 homolog 1) [Durusdinium trenchii]|uniref:Carbon catabolite repressor protein 4 homolog 1 (CCR4 homolog 1) n=1 Tax=Durusdinium trenchii TaxID=1381693 RepID=A0ABP0RUS2_9DINO